MSEKKLSRLRNNLNQRKLVVGAGSAAIGLAGLAYAAHELHDRQRARPEDLLDETILNYRHGAILWSTAAIIGGGEIMSRSQIVRLTGLNPRHVNTGLSFLHERGLLFNTLMIGPDGKLESHYMAADPLLKTILDESDAYRHIVQAATELYPDFSLNLIRNRLDVSGSS